MLSIYLKNLTNGLHDTLLQYILYYGRISAHEPRKHQMSYTTHYSIITGVRRRKDDAWERFYREYASLIRLHGMDCGVPENELDDLVQNVMCEFFRRSAFDYDAGRGSFRAFLKRIIRVRSMDMLRKRYRERRIRDAAEPDDEYLDRRYDEEYREYLHREALRRLRRRVPSEEFRQFVMVAVLRRDVGSVAGSFHIRAPRVYSACRRLGGMLSAILREIDTGTTARRQ